MCTTLRATSFLLILSFSQGMDFILRTPVMSSGPTRCAGSCSLRWPRFAVTLPGSLAGKTTRVSLELAALPIALYS